MELHILINAVLGIFCAVLGWFGRELWAAVKKLQEDLAALEVRISRDYVRYDRLQDALRPIMDALHEIKDSLNRKADK